MNTQPINNYRPNPNGMSRPLIGQLLRMCGVRNPVPMAKAPIEKREQVILQSLKQAGRPLLLKEMEYLLPQLGISRDSLRICCDRMTEKGLIARSEIKVRYARAAFTYEVNK